MSTTRGLNKILLLLNRHSKRNNNQHNNYLSVLNESDDDDNYPSTLLELDDLEDQYSVTNDEIQTLIAQPTSQEKRLNLSSLYQHLTSFIGFFSPNRNSEHDKEDYGDYPSALENKDFIENDEIQPLIKKPIPQTNYGSSSFISKHIVVNRLAPNQSWNYDIWEKSRLDCPNRQPLPMAEKVWNPPSFSG